MKLMLIMVKIVVTITKFHSYFESWFVNEQHLSDFFLTSWPSLAHHDIFQNTQTIFLYKFVTFKSTWSLFDILQIWGSCFIDIFNNGPNNHIHSISISFENVLETWWFSWHPQNKNVIYSTMDNPWALST